MTSTSDRTLKVLPSFLLSIFISGRLFAKLAAEITLPVTTPFGTHFHADFELGHKHDWPMGQQKVQFGQKHDKCYVLGLAPSTLKALSSGEEAWSSLLDDMWPSHPVAPTESLPTSGGWVRSQTAPSVTRQSASWPQAHEQGQQRSAKLAQPKRSSWFAKSEVEQMVVVLSQYVLEWNMPQQKLTGMGIDV